MVILQFAKHNCPKTEKVLFTVHTHEDRKFIDVDSTFFIVE